MRTEGTEPRRPGVLLVDDHVNLLRLLAELLPMFGIHVVAAVSRGDRVVDAITGAAASGDPVDVVVMDVRMPGTGGLEAAREARAVFPRIAVILHTAFAGHLGEKPAEVGVFAEIPKGTDAMTLVDTIRAAWRAKQEADCAAAR